MPRMTLLALFLVLSNPLLSYAKYIYGNDIIVDGYYRKDGHYVQRHHRTLPDGNPFNNYSTKGNINPWTGKKGTVDPYKDDFHNPYPFSREFRGIYR